MSYAAALKLTDQFYVEDVVRNCAKRDVRSAAMNNMTNQSTLTYYATNDPDCHIRYEAAKKLIDRNLADSIFTNIANDDAVPGNMRLLAANSCSNHEIKQKVYTYVAKDNKCSDNERLDAIVKLTDQKTIADIAIQFDLDRNIYGFNKVDEHQMANPRKMLRNLSKSDLLLRVAKNAVCSYVSRAALEKLGARYNHEDMIACRCGRNNHLWELSICTGTGSYDIQYCEIRKKCVLCGEVES